MSINGKWKSGRVGPKKMWGIVVRAKRPHLMPMVFDTKKHATEDLSENEIAVPVVILTATIYEGLLKAVKSRKANP